VAEHHTGITAGKPGEARNSPEMKDTIRQVQNWHAEDRPLEAFAPAESGRRNSPRIREALAFGKADYDQRRALGRSVADLAGRRT
jgi:hypothetical protein